MAFALAQLCAGSAEANGRFPASVDVTIDGETMLVAATFGLIIKSDEAEGWRWICEEAIGYGGTFDPDYAVGEDGRLYATTYQGLRQSSDDGCSWTTVTDLASDTWVSQIEVAADGAVWFTTATTAADNDVFVDRGEGFSSVGLLTTTGWWRSLVTAPSDADRIYVAGYDVSGEGPPTVMLRRSDDGGGQWKALPTDKLDFAAQPLWFFEATSPVDPDTIFGRSVGANAPGDLLYRSLDAGQSWELVLATSDAITDIVVRRDGSTVIASTINGGVFQSTDTGAPLTFAAIAMPPKMACIAEAPTGKLYACGANWEPDYFSLGHSNDGFSWTPAFRFQDIAGPKICPADTPQQQTCVVEKWPSVCSQLGICSTGGSDAAAGGASERPRDCGCRQTELPSLAAMPALALLFILRRRRRHAPAPRATSGNET